MIPIIESDVDQCLILAASRCARGWTRRAAARSRDVAYGFLTLPTHRNAVCWCAGSAIRLGALELRADMDEVATLTERARSRLADAIGLANDQIGKMERSPRSDQSARRRHVAPCVRSGEPMMAKWSPIFIEPAERASFFRCRKISRRGMLSDHVQYCVIKHRTVFAALKHCRALNGRGTP